jgi:NADH-quinone oxidoreductase subunit G
MKVTVNNVKLDLQPGTSAIDAIFAAGYDVPYFCSQEYMSPIGACRMCLARIGTPRKNPDGTWVMDEATGQPKLFYFPNLVATCTAAIAEGMVIDTLSKEVRQAQSGMMEFTLINHPLDCPVCDKGGACELQDRAYEYGEGLSRFQFDKRHQEKHHTLSPLITLDRERCIHCKRCVRYFEEIPGDEVLDFIERGGHTYIGTMEAGLPSNFSGNIADICPVGALLDTTSRFRGRNWEYRHTRTTCLDCSVGCATVVDSRTGRLERIKAALNPEVNNIWLCDGGRFGHEYADQPERLRTPLIRENGRLVPTTWQNAADYIARELEGLGEKEVAIALRADATLEEGIAAKALAEHLKTGQLDHFPRPAGSVVPTGVRATLYDIATADAIFVIGDITEEAPILDLRVKEALKGVGPPELLPHGVPIADLRLTERMPRRRSILMVAAPYRVDLMKHAGQCLVYPAGQEAALLRALTAVAEGGEAVVNGLETADLTALATRLKEAKSAVIIYGGFVLASHAATEAAQALAKATGAKLLAVGPMANSYGLQQLGVLPSHARYRYQEMPTSAKALIISGLNPAQDRSVAQQLSHLALLVVHDSFLTETAELAQVVLPAKTGYEKEGSVVNLEGRLLPVAAVPLNSGASEDFTGVVKWLSEALGHQFEGRSAQRQLRRLFGVDPAELEPTGRVLQGPPKSIPRIPATETPAYGNLLLVPSMSRVEQLDRNPHLRAALGATVLRVNPDDAGNLGLRAGDEVTLTLQGVLRRATVVITDATPPGLMLLPALIDQPVGLVRLEPTAILRQTAPVGA